MNKRKFFNRNFVYLLISFLFAILLFVNANATNIKNNVDKLTNLTTYDLTIHDIPVKINYDDSEYFISGFDRNVNVYLTSYNRIRLDAEKSDATRSFKVVADLTKVQTGNITVPLRLQGLASGVTGQVDPTQLSITVEKKATKTFSVTPVVNEEQLAENYSIDEISLSKDQVKVTSGSSTINKIKEVRAVLPNDVELNQDYKGEVVLKAYDENDEEVACQISPETVTLNVDVTAPSKTVPLVAIQAGELSDKVEQVTLELSQETVKIYGSQSDIDKISQIKVAVDLSGVTSNRTITQILSAENVVVDPSKIKIKVTITPVLKSDK